ncbi:MAG: TspO/MBR family protein [Rubricoccaceae bacterium]
MPASTAPARAASSAPEGLVRWLGLAGWIALSFAASVGGAATDPSVYARLETPSWSPPAWLFGPVWTVLYALMGTAAWLVWLQGGWRAQRVPLTLFLVQLALNALWTPVFFGADLRGWALVVIVLLLASLTATLVAFWRVRPLAGALLVPYLAWVSFATALNASLWWLNR